MEAITKSHPEILSALDAYMQASGSSWRGHNAVLWDFIWSLMDFCDEANIDFESTLKSIRLERNRVLRKKAEQAAIEEDRLREQWDGEP